MCSPSCIQGNTINSSASSQSTTSADPVQESADKIESLIDSDGAFEWADANEVAEAANVLSGLDAQTADAVVDELATRGSLDKFADEVVDSSLIGSGLSADNRATLFDNFAKQLDADSLIRVTDAFRQAGTPRAGEGYAEELTQAINTHTSPAVKVEMVVALAARAEANTGTSAEAIRQNNADLEQAAEILSTLQGAHLTSAVEALDQAGTLDDVLTASVTTDYHLVMGRLTHTTYDTSNFDTIMENVAALSDANMKKDVFAAGVTAMETIDAEANPVVEVIRDGTIPNFNDEAANEMATSLTKVLSSDVDGVMQALTYDGVTANGNATTAYAKQMLEAGATDALGDIFAQLQFGNDLQGDPTARLETIINNPSGSPERPHAEALGHFVGSVYGASSQITSDQQEQAAYATAVLKGALTAIDKSKVGGAIVGTTASIAKESVSILMGELIATQDLSVAQTWESASIPVDADGRRSIGTDAFSAITDMIDHIYRLNQ